MIFNLNLTRYKLRLNRSRKGRKEELTNYNIRYKDDHLAHAGKKGMKWGFNDGQKNGKRTADPEWKMYEEIDQDSRDYWLTAKGNHDGSYRVPDEQIYRIPRSGSGKKSYLKTTYRNVTSDKVYTKFDQAVDKKNTKARKEAAYAIKRVKRRDNAERIANKAVDLYEDTEKKINKAKRTASKKTKQAKKWLNKRFK